jgi:hypothetical protein
MIALPPTPIPLPDGPPGQCDGVALDVCFVPQQENMLCWAACAAMVLQFFNFPVSMKTVMEFKFGHACPDYLSCNLGCDESDILWIYRHFGVTGDPPKGVLKQTDLVAELNGHRPVEVGLGDCGTGSGGMGHVVVVFGYCADSSGLVFLVHDSAIASSGRFPYSSLKSDMSEGCWIRTWANLRPA